MFVWSFLICLALLYTFKAFQIFDDLENTTSPKLFSFSNFNILSKRNLLSNKFICNGVLGHGLGLNKSKWLVLGTKTQRLGTKTP